MNNIFTLLPLSISYVINFPFFWASMGFMTAISMLLTATFFDHEFKWIARAGLAKASFIFFLFWINYSRIDYSFKNGLVYPVQNIAQPYSGVATLLISSLFWFLGMFIGILILKFQKKMR